MFAKEKEWILETVREIPKQDLKLIVDIGSGSIAYRTEQQPYIGELYEQLAREFGAQISTVDFSKEVSPNYAFDITESVPKSLIKKFDLVLATNLLEHVKKQKIFRAVSNISLLLRSDKYLICTVPYKLPPHKRPIDNGLRPDCTQLNDLLSENFQCLKCNTWIDEHYREPYISNPRLSPKPEVTGGLFSKNLI